MLKHRKAGGPVFGLALVSMLVFAAFAANGAQASPVWHVNGKTFAEAGISQKEFVLANDAGGVVKTEIPSWGITVNCGKTEGGGSLEGTSSGTGTLVLNNCVLVEFEEECQVEPITLRVSLGLESGGKTGAIGTFTPNGIPAAKLVFTGQECPIRDLPVEIINGEKHNFAAEIGAEALSVPLTGISTRKMVGTWGSHAAYISMSGSFKMRYLTGQTLGAW
jgi:hypothetical protein